MVVSERIRLRLGLGLSISLRDSSWSWQGTQCRPTHTHTHAQARVRAALTSLWAHARQRQLPNNTSAHVMSTLRSSSRSLTCCRRRHDWLCSTQRQRGREAEEVGGYVANNKRRALWSKSKLKPQTKHTLREMSDSRSARAQRLWRLVVSQYT